MMKVDMNPEAVTNRMIALDQLWELGVALKSSKIIEKESTNQPIYETADQGWQEADEK